MAKTGQQLFNEAWKGLKAQGFQQSRGEAGSCAYRGQNGLKCALGHCMSDEDYKPALEGFGAYSPRVMAACGYGPSECYNADALQACHDCSYRPAEMEKALRDFATERGFTIPE